MSDILYRWSQSLLRPLKGMGLRRFAPVRRVLGTLKPNTTTVRGRTFYLDSEDFAVSEEIRKGDYEAAETALMQKLVRTTDTVVDIGANIGYFTTLFADMARDGRVHAFEPSPRTFALLERNVRSAGFAHVSLYHRAVGEGDGEAELYINEYNKGDNRLYPSFGAKGVPVRVVALDGVLPPGTSVDVIKMDIQGYEVHALRGMRRVLNENPGLYLMVECWPKGLRRAGTPAHTFFALLQEIGFSWALIDDTTGRLIDMRTEEFLERYPSEKDEYGNLLCWRTRPLPPDTVA